MHFIENYFYILFLLKINYSILVIRIILIRKMDVISDLKHVPVVHWPRTFVLKLETFFVGEISKLKWNKNRCPKIKDFSPCFLFSHGKILLRIQHMEKMVFDVSKNCQATVVASLQFNNPGKMKISFEILTRFSHFYRWSFWARITKSQRPTRLNILRRDLNRIKKLNGHERISKFASVQQTLPYTYCGYFLKGGSELAWIGFEKKTIVLFTWRMSLNEFLPPQNWMLIEKQIR